MGDWKLACFIIKESGRPDRRFDLPRRDVQIGRDVDCELVLPNVSVSRQHARIRCVDHEYLLENTSKNNQVVVNGQVETKRILATRDEVQLGKFMLVFFGDRLNPGDQLQEGRMLSEFPAYQIHAPGPTDSTFQLSPAQVKRMRAMMRKLRSAVVRRLNDEADSWRPEDQTLTFGKKEGVLVTGWLVGAVAATMEWAGTGHVLKRQGLAKVKVNGEAIQERPLRSGDEFTIGSSGFVYSCDE